MEHGRLLISFFLLLATSSAQTPGASSPSFTITISAAQSSVKIGSPAIIHIVLKNTSSAELRVPQVMHPGPEGELNYRIETSRTDGTNVPDTKLGRQAKNGRPYTSGSSMLVKFLSPGDEITENADLNRVVEITTPGDYRVRVERADPRYSGMHVKSNSIVVHITP